MNDENELLRLQAKTPEQKLLQVLENEFRFAPRMAEAILQEAQGCLLGRPGELRPGQIRQILARRGASHGQALQGTTMVEVVWTVDAGREDRRVQQMYGCQALRQMRLLRLLDEAVEQGGVATQEDLAQALHTSLRTIKRDFQELQAQGYYLPSRGNLQGVGRGQTHKAQIIRRWLNGETYDQLARHTHHSAASISRYVRSFVQVIQLRRQGFVPGEIARLLQMGQPLVEEYLAVEESLTPEQRNWLENQMGRFSRAIAVQKGAQ